MKKAKRAGEFADATSQALAAQDRSLFGELPKEFSPRRLIAAQSLGLRFFKLNDSERSQLNDVNFIYDGIFWDACLTAYLCICPDSELFTAVRLPGQMTAKIMAWTETKKLNAGSAAFNEVMAHYNTVMEHIIRSGAEPQPSEAGKATGEVDLPGE